MDSEVKVRFPSKKQMDYLHTVTGFWQAARETNNYCEGNAWKPKHTHTHKRL